jgi:hypothetical protein
VLSYGGGLDSFAMLLGAIRSNYLPDVCVFMDVGDGSETRDGVEPGEWPGTYRHMREVVLPLCAAHGIEFVWISKDTYPIRAGRKDENTSLYAWLRDHTNIPTAGPVRNCTALAKVERFESWMADRYGSALVEVWIGFEAGEEARANKDPNARGSGNANRRNRFPLIEAGLCRCRCEALVRELGFPVPRKSACVFCPYGTRQDWVAFERELPEQFEMIAQLEEVKPATSKGFKLSIKDFRKINKTATNPVLGVDYKAPPIRQWVKGKGAPVRAKPCSVCGAADRATKNTGCGYLAEGHDAGLVQLGIRVAS